MDEVTTLQNIWFFPRKKTEQKLNLTSYFILFQGISSREMILLHGQIIPLVSSIVFLSFSVFMMFLDSVFKVVLEADTFQNKTLAARLRLLVPSQRAGTSPGV